MSVEDALATARVTVDLAALRSNYALLKEKAGNAECAAAIKANAYGIGVKPAALALWKAGCRTFFVARAQEGAELRTVLPKAILYVLDGLLPGQAGYYAQHDLRPALVSLDQIREWATFGKHLLNKLPCALHVDTGINRLGLPESEFDEILANRSLMPQLNISLLMSHLACSDEPRHPLNKLQLSRFQKIRDKLPKVKASLANSSGIFLGPAYAFDLVRPGIALYGGNPLPGKKNPMTAVARLEGRILQLREVKKGEPVGYGATWKAPRDSRIAVVGAGYRDGIPRMLSSSKQTGPAQVLIAGKRCPIVGRVSMDMTCADVTALKLGKLAVGDFVEYFGHSLPVDEVAAWAGTISYELLTHLGTRYAWHSSDT